jgi:hypothetical protein
MLNRDECITKAAVFLEETAETRSESRLLFALAVL